MDMLVAHSNGLYASRIEMGIVIDDASRCGNVDIAVVLTITKQHDITASSLLPLVQLFRHQSLLFDQQLLLPSHSIPAFLIEQSLPLVLDVDRSSQLLLLLAVALLLGRQVVKAANAIHHDRGQHVNG